MDETATPAVKIRLTDDRLLVANNGAPFTMGDLYALTLTTRTTKAGDTTIGHKGRGFTSVLGVTDNPRAFSESVQAQFHRGRSAETLTQNRVIADAFDGEVEAEQVPLLSLPHSAEPPADVQSLLSEGFTTVFELPLRDTAQHHGAIQRKLQSLSANTVALLPELEQIDIECPTWERSWRLSRQEFRDAENATLIEVSRETVDGGSTSATTDWYCLFERTEIDSDHIAARSDLTDPEIDAMGQLRVGVAFRATPAVDAPGAEVSDWALEPIYGESRDRPPMVHVFLPTKERSPIPALVTGTFQSDTSRRNLTLDHDGKRGYEGQFNGYLFEEVGTLFAQRVLPFIRTSATAPETFVDALDPSLGQRREWSFTPGDVDHCLFEQVNDAVSSVPFLPSAFGDDRVSIDAVRLPPTSTDLPTLGEQFVQLLQTGATVPQGLEALPDAVLLDHPKTRALEAYGASRYDTASVPELLADASVDPSLRLISEEEWEIAVPEDAEPCRLLIDPVLEYLVAVRKPLESDDDRAAFDDACRRVPLLPTAVEFDDETARAIRRANRDGTVFMPPENDIAGGVLPNIQFFASELYHGSDPNRAKPLREAALPAEFAADIRTVWNIKEYQFTQVFDTAISPQLPGPNSPDADPSTLYQLETLDTIRRMAAVQSPENPRSPDAPLLYQSSRKPFSALASLPVPTVGPDDSVDWQPAHRVYFSSAWQTALGRPEEAHIEELLRAVGDVTDSNRFEPRFLAPPEWFGLDPTESESPDEEHLAWAAFLQWLGVAEHVRPLPLFAPDPATRHRYRETQGLSRPPRSTISSRSALETESPPVDHRYRGLTESDWTAYREQLASQVDPEIPDSSQQYLSQVNALEYAHELTSAAREESAVGVRLLRHLVCWWNSGLSAHRHAEVAAFTNKQWRGSNRSYFFTTDERERLGQNLWVWQLRQTAWVPTTFGAVRPPDAWRLPDADEERFTLDVSGKRPLLPFVTAGFPARETDEPEVVSTLAETLGIGRRLDQESFSPQDAYNAVNRIGELLESSEDPAQFASAVELLYTRIAELLPGLEQSEPLPAAWRPDNTGLGDVDLLCRVGQGYELVPASDSYYVRSRSSRDRYANLGVPILALFKPEAASFGSYCGARDLRTAVRREPAFEDCPPLPLSIGGAEVDQVWLETLLAALLLRLRTNRQSAFLVDQDRSATRTFYEQLTFVKNLDLRISLADGSWDENRPPESQAYHLERDGDRIVRVLVDQTLDRDAFVDALTGAFTERLDIPQYYEAVNMLVDHALGEPEPGATLEARLRTVGSDVPSGQVEATRKELFADERDEAVNEAEEAEPVPPEPYSPEETEEDDQSEHEPAERTGSTGTSGTAHSAQVPAIESVTSIGDRRVAESLLEATPTTGSSSDSTGRRAQTNGGGGGGGAGHGTSQEYRTEIDAFGMELTMKAERERLREAGERNPAEQVFDVHTPEIYEQMRKEHASLDDAIERFGDERGLSSAENPLNRGFPGFDVLTLRTDADGRAIVDRCIELKTSGVNTRKPSLSWNEWKAAGGPLSEHYYLYVARNIRTGNSGDAELLEIPRPFERLRNRTKEKRERNVQVDLRSFDFDADPIIRQPIEWEE
nr:ATP-binding protein [Halobaculum saliterrae]